MPATPAGQSVEVDASVLTKSSDTSPSGHGNLAGATRRRGTLAAAGEFAAAASDAAALSGWKV